MAARAKSEPVEPKQSLVIPAGNTPPDGQKEMLSVLTSSTLSGKRKSTVRSLKLVTKWRNSRCWSKG